MPQDNVTIVRQMWEAFLGGDVPTALSFYSPDVEWDGSNLPDGPVGTGHDVIIDHVARWRENWEVWTVDVERIIDVGPDRVILLIREKGKSASGVVMDEIHAELYTLDDDLIVRRQGFSDPSEAFAAAGVSG
jgi:ketosteroid isomerase-like protein